MSSIRINNNWKVQKTPIYDSTIPLTIVRNIKTVSLKLKDTKNSMEVSWNTAFIAGKPKTTDRIAVTGSMFLWDAPQDNYI